MDGKGWSGLKSEAYWQQRLTCGCVLADGRSRSEVFLRLRPDFSAVAAGTHVSDSAVPWRRPSTSYDQVGLQLSEECRMARLSTVNIPADNPRVARS